MADEMLATSNPEMKAFIDDVVAVYRKHGKALYNNEAGHHTGMTIIKFHELDEKYLVERTGYDPELFEENEHEPVENEHESAEAG